MRPLRLASPPARGHDVTQLQKALNNRLQARDRRPIKVDGEYGQETANAVKTVGWLLGVADGTLAHGATVGTQRVILHPGSRTPQQLARARSRAKQLQDGKHSVSAVLEWAESKVGITEHPSGSNRGPDVDRWEREFHMLGQPWCGAFVGFGLRRVAGVPVGDFVVFVPSIMHNAMSRTGGFALWVPPEDIQRGDLVVERFSSHGDPEHVELARAAPRAGRIDTVAGNTSSGDAGSQSNGGGVFNRSRPLSVVLGGARPRY
jgi:peptidoglycan hydrolase-like protein with peptidoglycan-binding domain